MSNDLGGSGSRMIFRLPNKLKLDFEMQCKRMGSEAPAQLREFMTAFNEGRLTIAPTEAQVQAAKLKGEVYTK